jgi:hypothetical protein
MTRIFISTAVRTSILVIKSCFCNYKKSFSYNLENSTHTHTHILLSSASTRLKTEAQIFKCDIQNSVNWLCVSFCSCGSRGVLLSADLLELWLMGYFSIVYVLSQHDIKSKCNLTDPLNSMRITLYAWIVTPALLPGPVNKIVNVPRITVMDRVGYHSYHFLHWP